MLNSYEPSTQNHLEEILVSLKHIQQDLDWATELLKTHAVYRCRSDLTLLDRCAEAQWVARDTDSLQSLMSELAGCYPEFTADWFRC